MFHRPQAADFPARLTAKAGPQAFRRSTPIAGETAAHTFFEPFLAAADHATETLFVAHVDERAHCIHVTRYAGQQATAQLPVRAILLDAAALGSSGLVLAHNHPSGDPTPSSADRSATRRLAAAGEAIDVTLLDHLVFGGRDWTSMRKSGLL